MSTPRPRPRRWWLGPNFADLLCITLPSPVAETLAVTLLVATLAGAVVRPKGLPEAVFAVPAAIFLVLVGVLPLSDARAEAQSLAPTIGFLAAILVLADLCDRYGLFEAAGAWTATSVRAHSYDPYCLGGSHSSNGKDSNPISPPPPEELVGQQPE